MADQKEDDYQDRLRSAFQQLDTKEEHELKSGKKVFAKMKNALMGMAAQRANEEKDDEGKEVPEERRASLGSSVLNARRGSISDTMQMDMYKKLQVRARVAKMEYSEAVRNAHQNTRQSGDLDYADVPDLTPETKVTPTWVRQLLDEFSQGKILAPESVVEMCRRLMDDFSAQPNVVRVALPPTARIAVIGDIHGQLIDLNTILKLNGSPTDTNQYLFNGDVVDRGENSCECLLAILAYRLLYPGGLHINRGNHEAKDINERDGFEKECLEKYDYLIFDLFERLLSCLPIAHIIQDKVFVVHGGPPCQGQDLDAINAIHRFYTVPILFEEEEDDDGDEIWDYGKLVFNGVNPDDGDYPNITMEQMLWSDPCEEEGLLLDENPRGAGYLYGRAIVEDFLEKTGCDTIIRSHECVDNGFQEFFDGQLYTVFSASYYGNYTNRGAFCIIDTDLKKQFVVYTAHIQDRFDFGALENTVMQKLIIRISKERLGLVEYYSNIAVDDTITRQQWAKGLQEVLGLPKIPFEEFQSPLCLPTLGVHGHPFGPINYHDFLDQFEIYQGAMSQPEVPQGDEKKVFSESELKMQEVVQEMFRNRPQLEAIFRYFDTTRSGDIEEEQFARSIMALYISLKKPITEQEIQSVINTVNFDTTMIVGERLRTINYTEFFDKFTVRDERLDTVMKIKEAKRRLSTVGVLVKLHGDNIFEQKQQVVDQYLEQGVSREKLKEDAKKLALMTQPKKTVSKKPTGKKTALKKRGKKATGKKKTGKKATGKKKPARKVLPRRSASPDSGSDDDDDDDMGVMPKMKASTPRRKVGMVFTTPVKKGRARKNSL